MKNSAVRRQLENALPGRLPTFRWFGAKARRISKVRQLEWLPLSGPYVLAIFGVVFEDRKTERYLLPLSLGVASGVELVPGVRDASEDPEFHALLLEMIRQGRRFPGEAGSLHAIPATTRLSRVKSSRLLGAEQSNSSILYGQKWVLKLFRRLSEGENPDIEISRHLTEKARFRHSPRFAGALEYRSRTGGRWSLGCLQAFVPSESNAWEALLGFLDEQDDSFDFAKWAELLGKRTMELHLALVGTREFRAEPFTPSYQKTWVRALKLHARRVLAEFEKSGHPEAPRLTGLQEEIERRYRQLAAQPLRARRARIHGDYHLGQVLWTGRDFVILDFEGEPSRTLAERRAKQSPLRDVAGMLRSFHYAAHCCRKRPGPEWYGQVCQAYLRGYLKGGRGKARFLPKDEAARSALLQAYVLEKALYELSYEMNHRPDWIQVPLAGIFSLLETAA